MTSSLRLPDFLVIGAAKSGTTSLFSWLGEHPGVWLPEVKEPHFFTQFDLTQCSTAELRRRVESDYLLRYFPDRESRGSVLAEGGPTLNGELARAGLLDELCVTLAPRLASGDAKRILAGSTLSELGVLALHSVCEQDDYLFFRYRPQMHTG